MYKHAGDQEIPYDEKVIPHQIVDHGVEHEQYFQGCGVSFTPFQHCFTGIGCTPREALDDALEQAAMCGHNVDSIPNDFPDENVELPSEDHHYYVSIRI